MVWMALLMCLPLLGLALFFVYPWRVALVPYLILVGVSGYFDWLMMHAMHLPVRSGRKGMIGSMAVVLNWRGDSGQVTWKDEIWQALTRDGKTLRTGERVVIDSVSGLTLSVKPAGSEPHEDST
jgi:membrane protein implicated in regulation of membrane protease activity